MQTWRVPWAGGELEIGRRTLIMGILNVTPDSFADGGRYADLGLAVRRAWEIQAQGADILDVGGESTRPGHLPVTPQTEIDRVVPVLRRLKAEGYPLPISIDTSKAKVATAALDAGAHLINDQWGLQADPELASVAADAKAAVILMHNQKDTAYRNLIADIIEFWQRSLAIAAAAGIPAAHTILDPGIGFGKTATNNLDVLRDLRQLTVLGRPLLVGTSRKSTIGKVLGDLPVEERLEGTAATVALAIAGGADLVRVHDVQAMVRVARVADAVIRPGRGGWAESGGDGRGSDRTDGVAILRSAWSTCIRD